jgi:hypothetical protein
LIQVFEIQVTFGGHGRVDMMLIAHQRRPTNVVQQLELFAQS